MTTRRTVSNRTALCLGLLALPFAATAAPAPPATPTWSPGPSMSRQRIFHTATRLLDGRVLVTGGSNLATTEIYDPGANSWSEVSPLNRGRSYHTATLLPTGKVLVAGGFINTDEYPLDAELFDPATNAWSAAGTMRAGRVYHAATLLNDGRVLLSGGYPFGGALASTEIYDPMANTCRRPHP